MNYELSIMNYLLTLPPLSAPGRWQDAEFPVMPRVEMYNNLIKNQTKWQI